MSDNSLVFAFACLIFLLALTFCGKPDLQDALVKKALESEVSK